MSLHDTSQPSVSVQTLSEPPAYQLKTKPQTYALDRRDWMLAPIALALSLFAMIAGVWGTFQAGFTAAFDLTLVIYSVYFARKGTRIGVYPLLCGVLSAALSAVFVITTEPTIRFFSVCVMAVLCVVWFASLAQRPMFPGELGLAKRVLVQAECTVTHMPKSLRSLLSSQDPRVKSLTKVLLGLLCASPVLCAVLALLIRSDAAFEGLMQHLVADIAKTAAQIILAACLFPFLLSFGFSTRKDTDKVKAQKERKGIDTPFLAAFIALLAVCYLVYLLSQLAYFFSAFSGILPEGFTFSYAEYARRGFFELCWIAGINLAVLYLTLLLSRKTNDKLPVILRALCTFVDLFTLVLIGTAIAKMALYIKAFGVTVLRLGTSACMVLMAVVFLAMLLRFYCTRVRVLPVALITAAVILLTLGTVNIRAFAARYNYTAYQNRTLSNIDTQYLYKLGAEGVPYLIRLTECDDDDVRRSAYGHLVLSIESLYQVDYVYDEALTDDDGYPVTNEKYYGQLSRFCIPYRTAYRELDALLATQPDFLQAHASDREAVWEEMDPMMLF